jgi:hypothetical protein
MALYLRAITLATCRLAGRGQLARDQVSRLRQIARLGASPAALTHADLSIAHLVVTRGGRVRAVDEERVAVRPLAYDLSRAVCLCQTSCVEEREFLVAYRQSGGDPRPYTAWREFWIASALATSVLYRMRYQPSALPPIVRAIRGLFVVSAFRRTREGPAEAGHDAPSGLEPDTAAMPGTRSMGDV